MSTADQKTVSLDTLLDPYPTILWLHLQDKEICCNDILVILADVLLVSFQNNFDIIYGGYE